MALLSAWSELAVTEARFQPLELAQPRVAPAASRCEKKWFAHTFFFLASTHMGKRENRKEETAK